MREGGLVVDDVADPVPAFGQVLVRTLACGICGSDLHFLRHGRTMVELGGNMGMPDVVDFGRDIYMGHEFACEVLDVGPDTSGPKPGTIVTSMPAMLTLEGVTNLAYNNDLPGGYSERMLLSAPLLLEVPNGLDAERAALTEPMAVGVHAVNRSRIEPGESAVVLGCRPVGLACVAALRQRGVEVIVAADLSPARRRRAGQPRHPLQDPRRARPRRRRLTAGTPLRTPLPQSLRRAPSGCRRMAAASSSSATSV